MVQQVNKKKMKTNYTIKMLSEFERFFNPCKTDNSDKNAHAFIEFKKKQEIKKQAFKDFNKKIKEVFVS